MVMALIRWEPFREIDTLQREMNRLLEGWATMPTGAGVANAFIPPAELQETPESIRLKIEVPGLQPDDFEVQVTAEAVSVKGERKTETKSEENGSMRTEFRYGRFQRVIPLPARIQNDKVEAAYDTGVLTLTLPKAEAEQHKIVKVKVH